MAEQGTGKPTETREAAVPVGVNHVVLNVRDIEESHRFWTEVIGLRHVGTLRQDAGKGPKMRFYSGEREGEVSHHDIALVEDASLPPPQPWSLFETRGPLNHIAIAMPDRASWMEKLAALQARGVAFRSRVNHGVTHSVYIADPNGYGVELLYELPRALWEGDIEAGLNYFEPLPTEGEAALEDDLANAPRFGPDLATK